MTEYSATSAEPRTRGKIQQPEAPSLKPSNLNPELYALRPGINKAADEVGDMASMWRSLYLVWVFLARHPPSHRPTAGTIRPPWAFTRWRSRHALLAANSPRSAILAADPPDSPHIRQNGRGSGSPLVGGASFWVSLLLQRSGRIPPDRVFRNEAQLAILSR